VRFLTTAHIADKSWEELHSTLVQKGLTDVEVSQARQLVEQTVLQSCKPADQTTHEGDKQNRALTMMTSPVPPVPQLEACRLEHNFVATALAETSPLSMQMEAMHIGEWLREASIEEAVASIAGDTDTNGTEQLADLRSRGLSLAEAIEARRRALVRSSFLKSIKRGNKQVSSLSRM
jgi:hypothetical protein